jgi:4-diphosphocytidyl-2C-methyl-D-erythritol kinase
MHVHAPAKINLHLRIGPPRADGFHPLLSWMTTIGLFDTLTISDGDSDGGSGQISMSCDEPTLPCDDRNLVIKAARLLRPDLSCSAHIHLAKQIPHGGGLGGGSSDAAFTLLALNRYWKLNKPVEALDPLAAQLGSDINFFLHGPSSVCKGRGEIVRPISTPSQARWALLLLANLSMPTPAVYRQFDQMRLGSDADVSDENNEPDWNQWAALPSQQLLLKLVNDLEAPAFAIQPALGNLRQSLEQALSQTVRMSGSGSSLFTLYDDHAAATKAATVVNNQKWCRAIAVQLCPASTNQLPF